MDLSSKFEGYGKFCFNKNITKSSLFEVENPCFCSFLGKYLHSLKRANPTTTAVFETRMYRLLIMKMKYTHRDLIWLVNSHSVIRCSMHKAQGSFNKS